MNFLSKQIICFYFLLRLTNEIEKIIMEQKDLEVISAKDENDNYLGDNGSNDKGNKEVNKSKYVHRSPHLPSKMLIERMNSNQSNNSSILPSNYGINTNFRFQNNQKSIKESKFKNKADANHNKKKNNYINFSYTPQYTSQTINLANCVYATPNYQQQSTPQQNLLFDSNSQRAILSPLYLYNNGNSNSGNNQHHNNNININRSPNINSNNRSELNYSNSPYCYTPNINNNYIYNNSNNGIVMLSPLTPNHNLFSASPYTNLFQNNNNNNNQYGFSPIINKQQKMNQSNNNKQKPINNHHTNSFFSFKPSQISMENEDILFDNMLNKKNKSKKIKKPLANDNLPNQAQPNSNNPNHNFNSLFGTNSINNKQKPQCNPPSKTQATNSPNINNINMSPPKEDQKNKINIENILYLKDKRATLMIKNIPNKYTISTFLDEINVEFKNKYDVFYLPIDYGNKCNLGFAFINFVDPLHIISFYDMYRGKKWKRFNSEKICELVYAKIQGKKELISHFEKGKVLSFDSEEKRPLILPTPNPLPKIKLPITLLDTFIKAFPFSSYSFENNNEGRSNNEFFYIESLYSY